MSDFIIATASTSDLDRNYLDEKNVPFISYTFLLNEKVHLDDCRLETKKNVFDSMRAGQMPTTSQITQSEYMDFFKSLMEHGKDVIYLDMSCALSNSYNNALLAEEEIKALYPNQNFYMVDTRCVTGGLALLVDLALAKKEAGAGYQECIDYIESIKMHIIHHFVVDDLKWLRKGGRLSNAAALIGTLLQIKPLLYVTNEGTLVASSKVHGRKHALATIVKNMAKDLGEYKGKDIYISHADCESDAQLMADKMRELYPELGEIKLFMEGPTIGAHVGPGFISIHYIGTARIF